jgi:hypothetical protein
MADIVVSGNSSGSVTLRAPDVSGTTILTLPTTSGTLVTTAGAASLTTSGNLTFTGTNNRILGDFSNATFTSRVAFQSSTTNGNTAVITIPNGTATFSGYQFFNNSDPTNAAFLQVGASSTANIVSGITGTGTYLPITMFTGNSERLRIDTSGNVGINTGSPVGKLQVDLVANGSVSNTLTLNNAGTGGGSGAAVNFYNTLTSQPFTARINSVDDGAYGYVLVFSTKVGGSVGAGALTERMRIDSSGNVGIGTGSPGARLDVAGNIRTTTYYNFNGNGSNPTDATGSSIRPSICWAYYIR